MKKLLPHILLTIALSAYALLFLEAFLRLFNPQAIMPRYVTAADYGVRMNVPGIAYQQSTAETKATIEINHQGMRATHDFTMEKPAGTARIALFGDSYFMGYEANYQHSFAAQLEQALEKKHCQVEILNFAVSGFGTAEMLRTLEARGVEYAPDIVLFQWHHTDPADNLRANLYQMQGERLVVTGDDYIPASGLRNFLETQPAYKALSEHSHAYAALREKTATLIKNMMTGGAIVNRPARVVTVAAQQEITPDPIKDRDDRPMATPLDLALIAQAEQASLAHKAEFYLVDIPSWHTRTSFSSAFRLLPETLRERPNMISPIERFRVEASTHKKIYWERGHLHLTPFGNALLADETAKALTTSPMQQSRLGCGTAIATTPAAPLAAMDVNG